MHYGEVRCVQVPTLAKVLAWLDLINISMHAFNSRAFFFPARVRMRIVRTGTSLIVCPFLGPEGLGYNALWIGGQRV